MSLFGITARGSLALGSRLAEFPRLIRELDVEALRERVDEIESALAD